MPGLQTGWRLAAVVLAGALAGAPVSVLAQADKAAVDAVVAGLKAKNPDFDALCKSGAENIRRQIVGVVMGMVSTGRLADPMAVGMAAGTRVREECPASTMTGTAATAADLRFIDQGLAPLKFEAQPKTLGVFSSLANSVFKPEGEGPFPAVVLMHTNGGLGNPHMRRHARSLLDKGYVVLLTESFDSRNMKPGAVYPSQAAKDAYAALAHLQGLSFVDKSRIYQAGYSWGALGAALLASPQSAKAFKSEHRFRATAAHYGTCQWRDKPDSPSLELLSEDSDRPVLMLMGERDIETPPGTCFPRLEQMKAAGRPVHWHVYPGITHAWDKAEESGYVYKSPSGESMTYTYDATATADSLRRMIEFFESHR